MAPPSFPYGNRFRVRRSRAAPSPLRKPKNKIAAQIATFLRLGIVAWPPIADRSTKAQEISRKNEPFPLFGDRKESLIEKKSCKEARIFVFSLEGIAATGRILRKTCKIPATKKTGEKRTEPSPDDGPGSRKRKIQAGLFIHILANVAFDTRHAGNKRFIHRRGHVVLGALRHNGTVDNAHFRRAMLFETLKN